MIEALVNCSAGLDVHQKSVTCTALNEQEDRGIVKFIREYPAFRARLREMACWLVELEVELAVLESTGIYRQSVYAALEEAGIKTCQVNTRHMKYVPLRKIEVYDSERLAELARRGLLRASFIPGPPGTAGLDRYRQKLTGCLAAKRNRLHKVLDDCGLCLGSGWSATSTASRRSASSVW